MKIKPLSAALIAAGVLAVGTAGAIDLPAWLKPGASSSQPSAPASTTVPVAATPPPVPMLSAQAVPNHRAIVKQSGPTVFPICRSVS